jgi:carboxylesterase type B
MISFLFILFVLRLALFSCHSASSSSFTPGLVSSDCGLIQGFLGGPQIPIFRWLGIPYGSSHYANNRFKPSKLRSESGECWSQKAPLTADHYGPSCVQATGNPSAARLIQSEDCLMLNVFAPGWSLPGLQLPVLVWIHGGSLVEGSGGSNVHPFNPDRLVSQGNFIVVSINYRLSVLGTLTLRELNNEDYRNTSGNYAVGDVQTALRWISLNIKQFGGDPTRITLIGHSTGGTLILSLFASSQSRGLFHSAISLSGSPKIDQNFSTTELLMRENYLPVSPCNQTSGKDLLNCLYTSDAWDLTEPLPNDSFNSKWLFGIPTASDFIVPLVFVDGKTVEMPLIQALQQSLVDAPIIFANVREESDLAPEDLVMNYSFQQWKQFLLTRFSSFPNSESIVNHLESLYPYTNYTNIQQAYDQISADKGTICGNIYLASQAAKSFQSPVYYSLWVQPPAAPSGACYINPLCPKFAFHGWDRDNLFVPYGFSYRPQAWEYQVQDWFFQQISDWIQTAGRGLNDPAWKRFQTYNASNEEPYYVTLIDFHSTTPMAGENVKQEQCQFWNEQFAQWWWQN